MDAIPSNLCTLVEQLEDARQFHDGAARHAYGPYRERHSARALIYAAMLSEIRDWESRKRQAAATEDFASAGDDRCHAWLDDSYASLLERVYRIHSAVAPAWQAIRARAAGDATEDGSAMDGRRRARECMHC